eukprot:485195-Pleurochrysis_carterae.AAC.5
MLLGALDERRAVVAHTCGAQGGTARHGGRRRQNSAATSGNPSRARTRRGARWVKGPFGSRKSGLSCRQWKERWRVATRHR